VMRGLVVSPTQSGSAAVRSVHTDGDLLDLGHGANTIARLLAPSIYKWHQTLSGTHCPELSGTHSASEEFGLFKSNEGGEKTVREWTAQPSDLPQRGEDT
jgi:hypothetical protein